MCLNFRFASISPTRLKKNQNTPFDHLLDLGTAIYSQVGGTENLGLETPR